MQESSRQNGPVFFETIPEPPNLPALWWEDGAKNILRGYNLQDIESVCRLGTYSDENLPREILRTRWTPLLDHFFLSLHGGDWETVNHLDKGQKIDAILEELVPSVPSSSAPWVQRRNIEKLPELLQREDFSRTASDLHETSCSWFKRIPFSDWARRARDPYAAVDLVDDFIQWNRILQLVVESRLRESPDEMEKFVQMEKLLPVHSPVRWAISRGLQLHYWNTDSYLPCHCLASILEELTAFFTRQHQNHIAAVRQLAILELRFQRMFLNEEEIDWSQRFWTDVGFFELITTTPAIEIADLLTKLDQQVLRSIPPQEFLNDKSHHLRHVHRRCNRLCEAIQESIICTERLSPLVARLAKGLHARRNFHSLIPTLQALRETGFVESALPELFPLIQSDRNYSCYRQAYEEAPAVPFLPPHIRQISHCQETGLAQIYNFLSYKDPPVRIGEKQESSHDQKRLPWYCASAWTGLLPCFPVAHSSTKS